MAKQQDSKRLVIFRWQQTNVFYKHNKLESYYDTGKIEASNTISSRLFQRCMRLLSYYVIYTNLYITYDQNWNHPCNCVVSHVCYAVHPEGHIFHLQLIATCRINYPHHLHKKQIRHCTRRHKLFSRCLIDRFQFIS